MNSITSILDRHGVEYSTGKSGWVEVKCPWCGDSDPSKHMGIRLDNGGYNCWRNGRHRGRDPARIIAAVLKIDRDAALKLVGTNHFGPSMAFTTDEFHAYVQNGMIPQEPKAKDNLPLFIPKWMKPFTGYTPYRFGRYLAHRGFLDAQALSTHYHLKYTVVGAFKDRIIFPIYCGGLTTWTGRTIHRDHQPRYKTLSTDREKARAEYLQPAVVPVTDTLWQYDFLRQESGKVLVVCEGPFDAMKVDWFGRANGIRATCLFGMNCSDEQIGLLVALRPKFERLVLLGDCGSEMEWWGLTHRLVHLKPELAFPPDGRKDPGEMTPQEVVDIDCNNHAKAG